jgi:hypothetical protein
VKSNILVRAVSIIGSAAFMMAAGASASTITYSTNAVGTGFFGTSLTRNSSSGALATLKFVPDVATVTGVPSYINFGEFILTCATCTSSVSATFSAFTFDLIITDTTDGATGKFVGTSTGGKVKTNSSTLAINWSPLILGPGTSGALSGNFGGTSFTTTNFTPIVAPNSGTDQGETTVQGFIDGSPVPEPATLSLVGGVLLGLGALRRRFFSNR